MARVAPGSSTPDLPTLWRRVGELAEESAAAGALVDAVEPLGLTRTNAGLLVQVRQLGANKSSLSDLQRGKLEALLTKAAGVAARVQVEQPAAPTGAASAAASAPPAGAAQADAEARNAAVKHPLVKRAMELFDAKLIRVDKP